MAVVLACAYAPDTQTLMQRQRQMQTRQRVASKWAVRKIREWDEKVKWDGCDRMVKWW